MDNITKNAVFLDVLYKIDEEKNINVTIKRINDAGKCETVKTAAGEEAKRIYNFLINDEGQQPPEAKEKLKNKIIEGLQNNNPLIIGSVKEPEPEAPEVSKKELEEVIRAFAGSIKSELTEKDALYYLSGYFKKNKVYIADVLAVLAQLCSEKVIKASH